MFAVRYDDARAIPSALIDRIIDGMPDRGKPTDSVKTVNLTKLRLRVMQYTGLSQAMLKRVEPHHLDFRKKTMYVTTRLKGAGVEGATVKMIGKAVDAWARARRGRRARPLQHAIDGPGVAPRRDPRTGYGTRRKRRRRAGGSGPCSITIAPTTSATALARGCWSRPATSRPPRPKCVTRT